MNVLGNTVLTTFLDALSPQLSKKFSQFDDPLKAFLFLKV